MAGLKFLLAGVGWVLLGGGFEATARRPTDMVGRIGLAGICGSVLLGVEMFAASWFGLPWSWSALAGALLLWSIAGALLAPRNAGLPVRVGAEMVPGVLAGLASFGLLLYSTVSARATSADLILFWGSKGNHFALARGIDVGFLRDPVNYLGHTDYPPLLPELYAFGAMFAGRFAWGAALLYTPLTILLAAASFWGVARLDLGSRRAATWTALLTTLLGYGICVSLAIGNADALVLAYLVTALSCLTFGKGRLDSIASVVLAGMVLAKVEGVVIAGLIVLAFSAGKEFFRRAWRLGWPAASAFAAWIAFCGQNKLLDAYRSAGGRLRIENLRLIVSGVWREASFDAGYLPWLVLLALVLLRGRGAFDWRSLGVGAGFCLFIMWMYAHNVADPTLFVSWSAKRLLMTPLLCFFFAGIALDPPSEPIQ